MEKFVDSLFNEWKPFEYYNGFRSPGMIDVDTKKYSTLIYFDGNWFKKEYDISDFIIGKTDNEIICGISDYIKSIDEKDGK